MKKTIIILSALIALVACNKENTRPETTPTVFNITINRADDTKAAKTAWENGDVVYVFFSTVAAPNYLKYTYNGSAWSNTKVGDFDITEAGKMTAIYLPYGNSETVSADGTSFKFGNTYTSYYLKAEKADYTVSGGVVSGTLDMTAPDGFVQFAMPITNGSIQFFRETAGAYTLKEANLTPCAFASVAADGTISNKTGYNAGDPVTGYFYGEGDARTINFSGILSSTGTATDYAFTFVNNMGNAETYDDVTYTLSGNKTIAAKAAIKFPAISSSAWTVPAPTYVEINGVKWATCNIGATTPGGYGDYFAWGATYPQAKYEESDYRESSISANLTLANDVASQKLGSDWHMPTHYEISRIIDDYGDPADGVTWTWISNTATYGTVGYEVYLTSDTSKKIFLPAAGGWYDGLEEAGSDGYYWSSEYNIYSYEYAWRLSFSSSGQHKGNGLRYYGQSVRPVHN